MAHEKDPLGRDPHQPGAKLDSESGLEHAAHAAWNALARLDLMIRAQQARQAGKPEGWHACGNVGMEASE